MNKKELFVQMFTKALNLLETEKEFFICDCLLVLYRADNEISTADFNAAKDYLEANKPTANNEFSDFYNHEHFRNGTMCWWGAGKYHVSSEIKQHEPEAYAEILKQKSAYVRKLLRKIETGKVD